MRLMVLRAYVVDIPPKGLRATDDISTAVDTYLSEACFQYQIWTTRDVNVNEAIRLAENILDPEMYGHAVTAEIRNRARIALGIPPNEGAGA